MELSKYEKESNVGGNLFLYMTVENVDTNFSQGMVVRAICTGSGHYKVLYV